MEINQYLTVSEAAALLRISRPTVYKMIREGRINALNTGQKYLIDADSLKAKTPHSAGQRKGVGHDIK